MTERILQRDLASTVHGRCRVCVTYLAVSLIGLGYAAAQEDAAGPKAGPHAYQLILPPAEGNEVPERIPPPTRSMTIEELQSTAMGCNPTVAQALAEVRELQGRWLQVGLRPNPVLGWSAEEMGNDGRAGRQGIEFSQEFITAGKLGWNRAVVEQQIRAARCELEAQRRRVLNDVQIAACRVLADQERIAILLELKKINEEVVGACEALLEAKELGRTDLLKAQIELETTTMRLRVEERELSGTRRALAGVVGRGDLADIRVAGSLREELPLLDWDASLECLYQNSPELRRAYASVAEARCDVARQRAGRKSDIEVGGAVAYNAASEYTEATVAVGMPVKLFDRNQGNIAAAESRFVAARREVDRLRLELYYRLAEVFRRYQVAREQAETFKQSVLPKAKMSLGLTREGFRHQESSYLELLNAQQTFFSSNLDYIESLEAVWITETQIDGLLLTGGLDSRLVPE